MMKENTQLADGKGCHKTKKEHTRFLKMLTKGLPQEIPHYTEEYNTTSYWKNNFQSHWKDDGINRKFSLKQKEDIPKHNDLITCIKKENLSLDLKTHNSSNNLDVKCNWEELNQLTPEVIEPRTSFFETENDLRKKVKPQLTNGVLQTLPSFKTFCENLEETTAAFKRLSQKSPSKLKISKPKKSSHHVMNANKELSQMSCGCRVANADLTPFYYHLGSGKSMVDLKEKLTKQFDVENEAIRFVEVSPTTAEGKNGDGCPIARWVLRRSGDVEKYLVVAKQSRGHVCEHQYTVVIIVAWEGIANQYADDMYEYLRQQLNHSGFKTRRRCGTNESKTCLCQGESETHEGASFTFGCSWSMFYDGCKFSKSKAARKYKMQTSKKEQEMEMVLQDMATNVSPLLHVLAPKAYENMTRYETVASDCRIGRNEGRPFSGVTCCLDFCAHSHKDLHNLNNGTTMVCTLLKPDTNERDDEQLHVLPLYRLLDNEGGVAKTNFSIPSHFMKSKLQASQKHPEGKGRYVCPEAVNVKKPEVTTVADDVIPKYIDESAIPLVRENNGVIKNHLFPKNSDNFLYGNSSVENLHPIDILSGNYNMQVPQNTPVSEKKNKKQGASKPTIITEDMGGVAIALGHGSFLVECARKELHATTALRKPNRDKPNRISMVFYQHKKLNKKSHGYFHYKRKEELRKQERLEKQRSLEEARERSLEDSKNRCRDDMSIINRDSNTPYKRLNASSHSLPELQHIKQEDKPPHFHHDISFPSSIEEISVNFSDLLLPEIKQPLRNVNDFRTSITVSSESLNTPLSPGNGSRIIKVEKSENVCDNITSSSIECNSKNAIKSGTPSTVFCEDATNKLPTFSIFSFQAACGQSSPKSEFADVSKVEMNDEIKTEEVEFHKERVDDPSNETNTRAVNDLEKLQETSSCSATPDKFASNQSVATATLSAVTNVTPPRKREHKNDIVDHETNSPKQLKCSDTQSTSQEIPRKSSAHKNPRELNTGLQNGKTNLMTHPIARLKEENLVEQHSNFNSLMLLSNAANFFQSINTHSEVEGKQSEFARLLENESASFDSIPFITHRNGTDFRNTRYRKWNVASILDETNSSEETRNSKVSQINSNNDSANITKTHLQSSSLSETTHQSSVTESLHQPTLLDSHANLFAAERNLQCPSKKKHENLSQSNSQSNHGTKNSFESQYQKMCETLKHPRERYLKTNSTSDDVVAMTSSFQNRCSNIRQNIHNLNKSSDFNINNNYHGYKDQYPNHNTVTSNYCYDYGFSDPNCARTSVDLPNCHRPTYYAHTDESTIPSPWNNNANMHYNNTQYPTCNSQPHNPPFFDPRDKDPFKLVEMERNSKTKLKKSSRSRKYGDNNGYAHLTNGHTHPARSYNSYAQRTYHNNFDGRTTISSEWNNMYHNPNLQHVPNAHAQILENAYQGMHSGMVPSEYSQYTAVSKQGFHNG